MAGRPWVHCDPELKDPATKSLDGGHAGKDAATVPCVPGAAVIAVIYNRARGMGRPPEVEKGSEARKDGAHAYDGFDGDKARKTEMLELENDVIREMANALKAGVPAG